MADYGFTCFGCGESIEFANLPDEPVAQSVKAERMAGKRGWGIGHCNGQGHIVCGGCEGAVFDFSRFGRR